MTNYRATVIVDIYPLGDIRNGLRLLAKHRGGVRNLNGSEVKEILTPSKLDALMKVNPAGPKVRALYGKAEGGLMVTGTLKEQGDEEDSRTLFATKFMTLTVMETHQALVNALRTMNEQDRLIILMHGNNFRGSGGGFNDAAFLTQLAAWMIGCGFRKAKKISLVVCYSGNKHPKSQGGGIPMSSVHTFAEKLSAAARLTDETINISEIVGRRGEVYVTRDGTKGGREKIMVQDAGMFGYILGVQPKTVDIGKEEGKVRVMDVR